MTYYHDRIAIPFQYRESGSIGTFSRVLFYGQGDSVTDWAYDCFISLAERECASYECCLAKGQIFTVTPMSYQRFVSILKDEVSNAIVDDCTKEERFLLAEILEGLSA